MWWGWWWYDTFGILLVLSRNCCSSDSLWVCVFAEITLALYFCAKEERHSRESDKFMTDFWLFHVSGFRLLQNPDSGLFLRNHTNHIDFWRFTYIFQSQTGDFSNLSARRRVIRYCKRLKGKSKPAPISADPKPIWLIGKNAAVCHIRFQTEEAANLLCAGESSCMGALLWEC